MIVSLITFQKISQVICNNKGKKSMNLLKQILSFNGRINRKTFWVTFISIFILQIAAFKLAYMSFYRGNYNMFIEWIVVLLFWPMIAAIVKRLHDRDKSGWWFLVHLTSFYIGFMTKSTGWFLASAFLPYVGWFWGFIGIGFLPGIYQINSFGSSTHALFSPGFNHMMGMLAKLAVSDTIIITTDEYKIVHSLLTDAFKLSGSTYKEAMHIFKASINSDIPYEVYARRFYTINGHDKDVLQAAFDLLVLVAVADGELTPEEDILIKQTVSIFNIDYEYSHDEYEEEEEEQTNYKSPDDHYASVLGLEGHIKPETVRQSYRNMVKQYHPDKVAHLGPKLREAAEAEMKQLNEAYEYFKKKLNM